MKQEEFLKLAEKVYGDKITLKTLTIAPDQLEALNRSKGIQLKVEDIEAYPQQAWVTDQEHCVNCGESLYGLLFGTFEWGIRHGCGTCSNCGTHYMVYHYLKDCNGDSARFNATAVTSIPQNLIDQLEDQNDQ